jgi:biopolymer transport protein TolR
MVKQRRNGHNLISDINITPFTDVVLVLLIIFLMAIPMLMQMGIELDMPSVTRETNTAENETVFIPIFISAEGGIFLDNQEYPVEKIKPLLQQLIEIDPESVVSISADPKASYDRMVQVIDLARAAGITRYVLAR